MLCKLHAAADRRSSQFRYQPVTAPYAAGQHGFTGYKSGSIVLAPGLHACEVDYSQVRVCSKSCAIRTTALC